MSTHSGTGFEDRSAGSASIGELFTDISKDMALLLRQEVELAKAEARQSAGQAGKGAGLLGGAGLAGYLALLFVSLATWWALGNAIGRGWSALILALCWALVSAGLAAAGRREVRNMRGLPQTVGTMKKIPEAVKGNEEAGR
jgi:hypothetical protein